MQSPEELKPVSVALELIIGEPAHIEYNVGSFWGGWGVGDTPYKGLCRKAPTNRINFNSSGVKVYERVGISTTLFPGFSPTHHYGVREPGSGHVAPEQNKFWGRSPLSLNLFVSFTQWSQGSKIKQDRFANPITITETMGNFCLNMGNIMPLDKEVYIIFWLTAVKLLAIKPNQYTAKPTT